MHRTRKSDDRNARSAKRLDLRRETLRRLNYLSDEDLRRAGGGKGSGGDGGMPSAPTVC